MEASIASAPFPCPGLASDTMQDSASLTPPPPPDVAFSAVPVDSSMDGTPVAPDDVGGALLLDGEQLHAPVLTSPWPAAPDASSKKGGAAEVCAALSGPTSSGLANFLWLTRRTSYIPLKSLRRFPQLLLIITVVITVLQAGHLLVLRLRPQPLARHLARRIATLQRSTPSALSF